jgi:hypothetical protein
MGKRKREAPFKPSDLEINTIFLQLVTNVPFLHSRRGVNAAWKYHLQELHKNGIALACHKQKTFTAWATRMCQERYAWRLAESRRNGTGEVEPSTALDEVMRKWEQVKLAGTSTKNPLQAELMRQACTTTATCLDSKTANIKAAMSKKYSGGTSAPAARSNSPSPSSRQRASTPTSAGKMFSPPISSGRGTGAADARGAFNDAMSSFSRSCESEAHILQEILAVMHGKQTDTSHDQVKPGEVEVAPLRAVLESAGEDYRSLVPFASTIYDALGISALHEFACITESDVQQVTLPAMQKRALLHLARAHNVGTKTFS